MLSLGCAAPALSAMPAANNNAIFLITECKDNKKSENLILNSYFFRIFAPCYARTLIKIDKNH